MLATGKGGSLKLALLLVGLLQLSGCFSASRALERQRLELPTILTIEYCSAGDPPGLTGLSIYSDGQARAYGTDLRKRWKRITQPDLARVKAVSESAEVMQGLVASAPASFPCSGSPEAQVSVSGSRLFRVGYRAPLKPDVESLLRAGNQIARRYFGVELFPTSQIPMGK